MLRRWIGSSCVGAVVACGPLAGPGGGGDGTATSGGTLGSTSGAAAEGSTGGSGSSDGSDSTGADGESGEPPPPDEPRLDVLFVIDDGPSMREEQVNVARNLVAMMRRLEDLTDGEGAPFRPHTQVMVTSASTSNLRCESTNGGTPVTSACVQRLGAFDDPAACESVCPEPVVPNGDFIVYDADGSNVGPVSALDLDGDGQAESAATRALACIGPQGTAGCPYAAPLEAIRAALDPGAPWNGGPEPFLRSDVPLAVIVISDGTDCSGADASVLSDDAYWEVDPMTGIAAPSPAICWNAGVQCEGPDADGWFTGCAPTSSPLTEIAAFVEFLVELREMHGKDVVMMGALGVPPVTAHNSEPPFEPIEGGIFSLQPRQWTEGDLLPSDADLGLTIADKHFATGIGPGCTGIGRDDQPLGQALPPLRVAEVCDGLDIVDDNGNAATRCCIESICDDDFSAAIHCLTPRAITLPPG